MCGMCGLLDGGNHWSNTISPVKGANARSQRLIASILQRGIDASEFRDVDPFVAARMLAAPFVLHGLWCQHRECFTQLANKTDDQVLDELMQFYLHAIKP